MASSFDVVGVVARFGLGDRAGALRDHDEVGGEAAHDGFDVDGGVGIVSLAVVGVAHAASSILKRGPKISFQTSSSSSADAKCAASQASARRQRSRSRSASVMRLATLFRL